MKTDDRIRQRAWLGLLDADRETLYLSSLANKMRRAHRITSTIVAVGSTAALASFVVGVSGVFGGSQTGTVGLQPPGVIGSAISLLVAVVAIWSMVSDYSRKAVIATSLSSECSELASRWRRLWIELGGLGDDEALKRVEDLERSDREITKSVPHDLGINRRLNERCAEQAYQLIKQEYPAAA